MGIVEFWISTLCAVDTFLDQTLSRSLSDFTVRLERQGHSWYSHRLVAKIRSTHVLENTKPAKRSLSEALWSLGRFTLSPWFETDKKYYIIGCVSVHFGLRACSEHT